MKLYKLSAMILAVVCCTVVAQAAINIETVHVGDPGNAGELSGASASGGCGADRICGAVDYTYNIGKYEVTAAQYTEFLNAVAKTDTYGLYDIKMDTDTYSLGCNIKRSNSDGSYSYSVASDWANRPVNCVSWGDAARFTNWLHNGQPTGEQSLSTTEDGAYYLNGAMTASALLAVSRKPGAKWVIPTEDEWYKAAYYDPNKLGAAGYWDYPTKSDTEPSAVLSATTDPGNSATWWPGSDTIGPPYYRTEVGAHENSASAYGTFDQGGNVMEWTEAVGSVDAYPSHVLRGGWCGPDPNYGLRSSSRTEIDCFPLDAFGFRVASVVPEPSSVTMLSGIALTGLLYWWRKRA